MQPMQVNRGENIRYQRLVNYEKAQDSNLFPGYIRAKSEFPCHHGKVFLQNLNRDDA